MSVAIKKERALAKDTTVLDREYKLPGGEIITVGRERFDSSEILMQPDLLGGDFDGKAGLAEMILESITQCDIDCRKDLLANIWLSGGTSMIPGLSTRLENDLKEMYVAGPGRGDRKILDRVPIYVHDPPRRKNAVFMGASFLASFAGDDRYVTKAEYEENGNPE